MISLRHVPVACLVMALGLVPVFVHVYAGATEHDGRTAASVPVTLSGAVSSPSDRNATWGKRRFDSDDWIERQYIDGQEEVTLTVVRSYDLKALYHHPELAVAYRTSFVRRETRRFAGHAAMPVHVLSPAPGTDAVAMYVLYYDGRAIEDPIAFQIRAAGELLFSRRKPMTLFFVKQPGVAEVPADPARLAATRVLLSAVDAFAGTARK